MKSKKLIAILLLFVMIFSCVPVNADPGGLFVSSSDVYGDETQIAITGSGYSPAQGKKLSAAVWSENNSNIIWYDMVVSGTDLVAYVPVSNHRAHGQYYVHVYESNADGTQKSYKGGTGFNISGFTASTVSTGAKDDTAGTCEIIAENVDTVSGVSSVTAEVWSTADKSDIFVYEMTPAETGRYTVLADVKNHNRNVGKYYAEVYGTANNGVRCKLGVCEFDFGYTQASVNAAVSGDKITVSAVGMSYPGGISSVDFAVWSKASSQADLKWFSSAVDPGTNSAEFTYAGSEFKNYGEYYVHVYGVLPNGKKVFIGSTAYTVQQPTADSVTAVNDNAAGSFTVKVNGVSDTAKKVHIAVWSRADASDMVWYEASKTSDAGVYAFSSNISAHKNNMGKYNVHVYLEDKNGTKVFAGAVNMSFGVNAESVAVADGADGKELKVTGISTPVKNIKLQYALWSKDNGQKDLKWFDAALNSSKTGASAKIDLTGYTAWGEYIIHVYAVLPSGEKVFVGGTVFTKEKPTCSSIVINTDVQKGKFDINIKDVASVAGTKKIRVAVWSKSDMSDLVWYNMSTSDGINYSVASSIDKHKYNTGAYSAHAYITDKTGMETFLCAESFKMNVSCDSIDTAEKSDQTLYTATIKNLVVPAGVKEVRVAVWSEPGGQDDLKWYTAKNTAPGEYAAEIDIRNHKTNGKYYEHVYVQKISGDMVFAGASEFTVKTTSKSALTFAKGDDNAGTFMMNLKVIENSSPVSKVEIALWPKNSSSKVCWYTAAKNSDGTYSAKANVYNHDTILGDYEAHVYITFANGIKAYSTGGSYKFEPVNFLKVQYMGSGKRQLIVVNPSADFSNCRFAIWNEADGVSKDCVWYTATKQADGTWAANFDVINHKNPGKYIAHCYANNNSVFVGGTTFIMNESEMKNGWRYENGYKYYYVNGVKQTNLTGMVGGPYQINVNRTRCTITVMAQDGANGFIIPVIAFKCSVGLPGMDTPTGVFHIFAQYRWKELMGPSWGQYASKITSDGVYFHSVAGSNTTSYNLDPSDYNMLGQPASHGCIRLCVRDAKWIFDNCGLGTTAYIFDSYEADPLERQYVPLIPPAQNWDPTDPNI